MQQEILFTGFVFFAGMVILKELWLLSLLLDMAFSFKNGAPSSMCASMMPHHKGASPQTSIPPYTITTSASTTAGDGRVSFKIQGSPFLGILLQARQNAVKPGAAGSFVTPNSLKTITCDNLTVRIEFFRLILVNLTLEAGSTLREFLRNKKKVLVIGNAGSNYFAKNLYCDDHSVLNSNSILTNLSSNKCDECDSQRVAPI